MAEEKKVGPATFLEDDDDDDMPDLEIVIHSLEGWNVVEKITGIIGTGTKKINHLINKAQYKVLINMRLSPEN